ncbi:fungal hydrophobin-domain-containing protein [Cerioporus squamosus]|nr:fungal hydrophobin-domain-containing protein [Cerioporus squamosus]
MFARTSLSVLSLAILAAAIPGGKPTTKPGTTVTVTKTATAPGSTSTPPASSCSTGDIQCCNSVQSVSTPNSRASDPAASVLLGLLGIVVQGVDVLVGLSCSPITVIGVGGGACSATAVCCQDNSHGGLISIGCLPVSL